MIAALRARLAETVAACNVNDVDESGAAVWGALLAYAPHLGVSARYLDDAADAEALAIQEHARTRTWPRKGRAPVYSIALREAHQRCGYWFASYVRESKAFTPEAVMTLRAGSVAMLACAAVYNRLPPALTFPE